MSDPDWRKTAHTVIERVGGLEWVASHEFPRAGDPPGPSLWKIYVCPLCFAPVWRSTSVSETDDWAIDDFASWERPFEPCSTCAEDLSKVAPPVIHLLQRLSTAYLMLLGSVLPPDPNTEEN